MEKSTEKYIGQLLDDRYEILELIGTGGMANVYKALCHRLNRFDAVKIMRDDAAANELLRERFRAESKAIAMLSHPNIVSVYDVGYRGNTEYIVMELVDGQTLKEYMQAEGPLGTEQVLDFSTQIAKALSHAHSKGIIHRDIKPQNVMLLKDGLIKVADFGIAAMQSEMSEQNGETIGSVHYIAPEQARGKAPDARSDIYSLGIVMYEMLTGRLPYEGNSELEVAVKHMNTEAVPPRSIVPEIPAELERICLKAMATDINERYQSADELLAELESFSKQAYKKEKTAKHIAADAILSDDAASDEKSEKKQKKKKKHAISSGIIAVLVLIILIFLFIIGYVIKDFLAEPEQMEIPGFVSRYYEDVINDADYKEQFDFTVKYVVDPDHEYGIISEQSPAEGSSVTPKSKEDKISVELTVSAGEPGGEDEKEVRVPNVVNQGQNDALLAVESEGLTYIIREASSQSIAKGYVIGTVPAAGESVLTGSEIEITISSGPETQLVPAPNLVGLTKDAAVEKIESNGLAVGKITRVESEYDEGTVIWQSVNGGDTVESRTKIDMQVSSGSSGGER